MKKTIFIFLLLFSFLHLYANVNATYNPDTGIASGTIPLCANVCIQANSGDCYKTSNIPACLARCNANTYLSDSQWRQCRARCLGPVQLFNTYVEYKCWFGYALVGAPLSSYVWISSEDWVPFQRDNTTIPFYVNTNFALGGISTYKNYCYGLGAYFDNGVSAICKSLVPPVCFQ